MKRISSYISIVLLCVIISLQATIPETHGSGLSVSVSATKYTTIPLKIIYVGTCAKAFKETLAKDLSFSGQCTISSDQLDMIPEKSFIEALAQDGYLFVIVIGFADDTMLFWRLYDTRNAKQIAAKKYLKQGTVERVWAHNVADSIWPVLTGKSGCFSSKIAYAKAQHCAHKKADIRMICMADYDGSHEEILVDTPTVNIAPRWNRDTKKPILLYSEYTDDKIRLVMVDMHKRRKVASNFDGINMLPAFSADGKCAVYCSSRADGNCHLYRYEQGELKRILDNNGNNLTPTLSADGSYMYFCSDYKGNRPHIYRYDFYTKNLTQISAGGGSMGPCYCPQNKKVAYSKIINGVMQIMIYDENTKEHTQITQDAGNKDEVSWSPCGNYLLYSIEKNGKSRVAMLNLATHHQRYITSSQTDCIYPAWSDIYTVFPILS